MICPANRCSGRHASLGRAGRIRFGRSVRHTNRDHEADRGRVYAELLRAEASQVTEHPDALGYILQGRTATLKPVGRRMQLDVMQGAWVSDMLLDAGRRILASQRG